MRKIADVTVNSSPRISRGRKTTTQFAMVPNRIARCTVYSPRWAGEDTSLSASKLECAIGIWEISPRRLARRRRHLSNV